MSGGTWVLRDHRQRCGHADMDMGWFAQLSADSEPWYGCETCPGGREVRLRRPTEADLERWWDDLDRWNKETGKYEHATPVGVWVEVFGDE